MIYESRILVAGEPFTGWLPVKHGAFYIVLRPYENVAANMPEGADLPKLEDNTMPSTMSGVLTGLALLASSAEPIVQQTASPAQPALQPGIPGQPKHPLAFTIQIENAERRSIPGEANDPDGLSKLERFIYRGPRPRFFAITNLGKEENQSVIIASYTTTDDPDSTFPDQAERTKQGRRYPLGPGSTYFIEAKWIRTNAIGNSSATVLEVVPLQ